MKEIERAKKEREISEHTTPYVRFGFNDKGDLFAFSLNLICSSLKRTHIKALKAVEMGIKKSGESWSTFMTVAEDAFENLEWNHAYGGHAWALIAKAYNQLMEV